MSNPFILNKKLLLESWKSLRESLNNNATDYTQLYYVVKFWSQAPLHKSILDWDKPDTWPDPWRFVHDSRFDESSVALGMFYTLILGNDERWNANRLQLMLIKDTDISIQKIVLEVDSKWLLNYEYNTIFDKKKLKNNFFVQNIYKFDGKFHFIS